MESGHHVAWARAIEDTLHRAQQTPGSVPAAEIQWALRVCDRIAEQNPLSALVGPLRGQLQTLLQLSEPQQFIANFHADVEQIAHTFGMHHPAHVVVCPNQQLRATVERETPLDCMPLPQGNGPVIISKSFMGTEAVLHFDFRIGDRTRRHEASHIVMDSALPVSKILREAVAGFCEWRFRAPGDPGNSIRRGYAISLGEPEILVGQDGWGIAEAGDIRTNVPERSKTMYSAHLAFVMKACGNDPLKMEALLRASKEYSGRKSLVQRKGKSFVPLPSLAEWLQQMEFVCPGFTAAFQQSPLSHPIPSGDRIVWHPHKRWGGILDGQRYTPNPAFMRLERGNCGILEGQLDSIPYNVKMQFTNQANDVSMALDRPFEIEPLTIAQMYEIIVKGQHGRTGKLRADRNQAYLPPPKGTVVSISVSEGAKPILLQWNEEAEQLLAQPNTW